MPPLEIDLFSDVVCPWCFIGSERLDRALDSLGLSSAAVVRYHPFLLMPDTPAQGRDLQEYLRGKYGLEPRQMFARVEAAARESGLALDLSRQAFAYSTLAAHTLLRHAGSRGTQRGLAKALFGAYFLEARNISDPDVLATLAAEHGFTRAEATALLAASGELDTTRRQAERASQLGIQGVPFFILNGRTALSGAQPEAVLRQALQSA